MNISTKKIVFILTGVILVIVIAIIVALVFRSDVQNEPSGIYEDTTVEFVPEDVSDVGPVQTEGVVDIQVGTESGDYGLQLTDSGKFMQAVLPMELYGRTYSLPDGGSTLSVPLRTVVIYLTVETDSITEFTSDRNFGTGITATQGRFDLFVYINPEIGQDDSVLSRRVEELVLEKLYKIARPQAQSDEVASYVSQAPREFLIVAPL